MRLLAVLALLAACDSGPVVTSGVAGTYVATRYITPGASDIPIDQLANGGSLRLDLDLDGRYTAEGVLVYELVGPPGPTTLTTAPVTYAGTYAVRGDTLVAFESASEEGRFPLSPLGYDAEAGVLADSVFGINPFILVLERRSGSDR